MKIPHIANFYWNIETPISYLRYLTLASFRHHHPGWKMIMWTTKSDRTKIWKGNLEEQDFMKSTARKDYKDNLKELDVEVRNSESVADHLVPNHVSNLYTFMTIIGGGWYFDMDQVFVRSFDDLCDHDFVIGKCDVVYTGLVGASERSVVPGYVTALYEAEFKRMRTYANYNDLGIWFLLNVWESNQFKKATEGEDLQYLPYEYFYPVKTSAEVPLLYEGKMTIPASDRNHAVHWYGGHPLSQKFNDKYTEEFAKHSADSISEYCRRINLI
jgi:hypothetical protein